MHSNSAKLGFWGLVALVFGLMVGVGIFNLPQNMAATSSVGAVVLAWIVTAFGMLTLVAAFKILSDKYPQYNAGIYQYAQKGFGEYAGFNAAWGYWLCTAFSNVAYAVMLNDAVGAFYPPLLEHGWLTVVLCSALIWVMYFVVAAGIKTAKIVNTTLAVVKIVVIVFIIYIFCTKFDPELLKTDLWGNVKELGSVAHQIKGSMMVTLFCFFGIEGAVMMSARAKRPQDVGRAGVVGFLISLVLYMLISVLCFGLMMRPELAALPDPSIAYILKVSLGGWAYYFVIGAVIVALLGGWVAWTLVVAQVPYEAAKVKILPQQFLSTNRNRMPTYGLVASSIVMEIFLLMVVTADNVYLAALHITGLMILPCYLFTGLFLLKKTRTPHPELSQVKYGSGIRVHRNRIRALAAICVVFCCWMIYAGGIMQMMMTSIFYLCGLWFFIKARREATAGSTPGRGSRQCAPIFSRRDNLLLGALSLASLISIFYLLLEGSPF